MNSKLVSTNEAANLIQSGDTVATSGFVGIGVPEALLIALESRFLGQNDIEGLTLLFAAGQGDGDSKGLNHLGHSKLLKRVIGGHWGLIPKVGQLAQNNEIEAYNLPQGAISHLYRDIAAGKPGTLSHVGLGTYVDPRIEGGKVNQISTEALVSVMTIDDKEYLFYKAFPINVALLRGTSADESGNITMEREALTLDNLAMAMAAKNSGGITIVQVERVVKAGSLSPRDVVIPGPLVDAVVIAEPEQHMQTFATQYSPMLSNELQSPPSESQSMELSLRKIIARRCALELPVNGVVNLGIGMPEGVAAVAEEEHFIEHVTLTAEPGVIGGQPQSGLDFGAALNTDAIIDQNQQFDFYDGGGLDLAVLGMAEAGANGDVNVSRFSGRFPGCGGFINISQNAKKVVFAGTFMAGRQLIKMTPSGLDIIDDGIHSKFVSSVEQITFSAANATLRGTTVLYVTERAVFKLQDGELMLSEIAPGVDVQKDILDHMSFMPVMNNVMEMDSSLFLPQPMGLVDILISMPLRDRIELDTQRKRLYLNFAGLSVHSIETIEQIKTEIEQILPPFKEKVDVMVNYDGFDIHKNLAREYRDMVSGLTTKFYRHVSRYSTQAFLRLKLGDVLSDENNPALFEGQQEATQFLDTFDK